MNSNRILKKYPLQQLDLHQRNQQEELHQEKQGIILLLDLE